MLLSELIPHLQAILQSQGDMQVMKYKQGGSYRPLQAPVVYNLKISGQFKLKKRWVEGKDKPESMGAKFLPL